MLSAVWEGNSRKIPVSKDIQKKKRDGGNELGANGNELGANGNELGGNGDELGGMATSPPTK